MSSADRFSSNRPDVRFQPAGPGHHSNFLCGCCGRPRSVTGRRLRHVLGLRTWVCAACAEGKK